MKVYVYKGCDSCRKALRWLKEKGKIVEELPIRETPPTKEELRTMLAAYDGDLRRLFNTSGVDYRAMGLKDRLPQMTEAEAFELMGQNGNLIKRPFLIGKDIAFVGFKPGEWGNAF